MTSDGASAPRVSSSRSLDPSSASTARAAAAAGLLSSCASPADERAQRDERVALPGGRLDRPRGAEHPFDEVGTERVQRARPLPSGPRTTPATRARRWRRGRWPGRRRARPRPGTRRPTAPARPSPRPGSPRGPRVGRGRSRPSSSTHQHSAGPPCAHSSSPASKATSPPQGEQVLQLVLGDLLEQREAAQLRRGDHVDAR